MSATSRLWKVIVDYADPKPEDQSRPVLPEQLIDALRAALMAGMSCEQVVACVYLMVGLDEMEKGMKPEELVGRCKEIGAVMSEWGRLEEVRESLRQSLDRQEEEQ